MSAPAPNRIIILGAQSAIAEAAARRLAGQGARLVLVGRSPARLEEIAADLQARGASMAIAAVCDLAGEADPAARLSDWIDQIGGLNALVLAYGALGDQEKAQENPVETRRLIDVNFTSAAGWLHAAALILERQRSGALVVIGSVAGDRGRASNYVYGAAKAGLAAFTQGLAHRLAKAGARAVVIKPGLVDTPMTAGFSKGGPLWASPDQVGAAVVDATARGGPVTYAPAFWRPIMLAIRAIPSGLFHRTKL
jgi:short-subunit dehydrogenase